MVRPLGTPREEGEWNKETRRKYGTTDLREQTTLIASVIPFNVPRGRRGQQYGLQTAADLKAQSSIRTVVKDPKESRWPMGNNPISAKLHQEAQLIIVIFYAETGH